MQHTENYGKLRQAMEILAQQSFTTLVAELAVELLLSPQYANDYLNSPTRPLFHEWLNGKFFDDVLDEDRSNYYITEIDLLRRAIEDDAWTEKEAGRVMSGSTGPFFIRILFNTSPPRFMMASKFGTVTADHLGS